MTIFATIDIANLKVTFHATEEAADAATDARDHFVATCAEDLTDLPGSVLVALYNATAADIDTNLAKVNKFANKETGAKRLWANLVDLQPVYAERDAALEKARQDAAKGPARDRAQPAKATDYPAPAKGRTTGINLAPKAKAYPCKAGTKQAILVDMLSRPEGATMSELLTALSGGSKPWQEVTVKSGLNWDMNNVKGYGIRTTQRDGVDCYHLVLPEGMTSPLPHTPRKG